MVGSANNKQSLYPLLHMSIASLTGYLVSRDCDENSEHTGWELMHGFGESIEVEIRVLQDEAPMFRHQLVTISGFYARWSRANGNDADVLVAIDIRPRPLH